MSKSLDSNLIVHLFTSLCASKILLSDFNRFEDCLKTGTPSSMVGDVFFNFTCSNCAEDGQEDVKRMKMQWFVVHGFPRAYM